MNLYEVNINGRSRKIAATNARIAVSRAMGAMWREGKLRISAKHEPISILATWIRTVNQSGGITNEQV